MQAAAACVTVKVTPATLSVPVRADVAVFADAEKFTVPFPLPGVPAVTVSQPAALVAVQAQPVAALTLTDPVDAVALSAAEVADSVGAHGAERAKVFDTPLVVDPPGPMAVTRDS